jgi:hypothetical protein
MRGAAGAGMVVVVVVARVDCGTGAEAVATAETAMGDCREESCLDRCLVQAHVGSTHTCRTGHNPDLDGAGLGGAVGGMGALGGTSGSDGGDDGGLQATAASDDHQIHSNTIRHLWDECSCVWTCSQPSMACSLGRQRWWWGAGASWQRWGR